MLPFIILGGIYGGISRDGSGCGCCFQRVDHRFSHLQRPFVQTVYRQCFSSFGNHGYHADYFAVFSGCRPGFTILRVPQEITSFMMLTFHEPWMVLLAVNFFLIIAGMIMDDISVTVIISPCYCP